MLYVNFQLERFEQYMIVMQKIQGSFVQDFEFGEDCNYKDYLQWGVLKLKVAFQLSSKGVNNLPIEGWLVSRNSFVAQEGEMVDDWLNFFAKSKIKVPSWWRRDRGQISTMQG